VYEIFCFLGAGGGVVVVFVGAAASISLFLLLGGVSGMVYANCLSLEGVGGKISAKQESKQLARYKSPLT